MVSPVWHWKINEGSRRQGHILGVDMSPIEIIDEYLPAYLLPQFLPNYHILRLEYFDLVISFLLLFSEQLTFF